MDKQEAITLLSDTLEEGSTIRSVIEQGDKFLFIAHRPDPLEGTFDPFFSVDKKTREVRDFSPQDYPNPLEIINKLKEVFH